ncbi:MAG: beta galactosidase jelly roll domain-containing protein, partial [Ignisphaera sp.]
KPEALGNGIEVTGGIQRAGIYVGRFAAAKSFGRFILDLGKGVYYSRPLIFVNKRFAGVYHGPMDVTEYVVDGENEIAIAVEYTQTALHPVIKVYHMYVKGSWKVSYGTRGLNEKWFAEGYNDSSWSKVRLPIVIKGKEGSIIWVRGKVRIEYGDGVASPLKLVLRGSGVKALIYFNGQFLGRYVDEGPQIEFYIPETLVQKGENVIAMMLHIISGEASINVVDVKPYYTHIKTELALLTLPENVIKWIK